EVVRLRLRVGEQLVGDPVPRDPALLERFVAVTASGEEDVRGVDGTDPAGALRVAGPGTVLVGYRSRRSPLELPADRFEVYLAQEGLEWISALRAAHGESAAPSREVFSRCAKSLLAGGGAGGDGFERRLGWPLEIVPEADPASLAAAAELPLTLLYLGEPLAGALVRARARADPLRALTARTDGAGRVTLRLSEPGPWLVTAVWAVEAPAGVDADWESFWASLTFELPAAGD
ncbi:MAG: DUF4198 domain-containing protein, partial [Thermoanaerobaculia bacterium]